MGNRRPSYTVEGRPRIRRVARDRFGTAAPQVREDSFVMLRSLRIPSLLLLVLLASRSVPAAGPSDLVGFWEGTVAYSDPGASEPYMNAPLLMEVTEEGGRLGGIMGFAGFVVDLKEIVSRSEGVFGFVFTMLADPKATDDAIDGRLLGDGSLEMRRDDETSSVLIRLSRVPAPESPVDLPAGLFTGTLGFKGKAVDEMQVSLSIKKGEAGPEITLGARKTVHSNREIAIGGIKAEIRGRRVVFTLESEGIKSRLYGEITGSSFRLCGQIPGFGGGSGVLSRSVQQ